MVGHLLRQGKRGRLVLAGLGAVILTGLAVVASPVLWLTGGLREMEWGGDFVTGVIVTAALYATIALGFVIARWHAPLYLCAAGFAVVLLAQASWTDDPARSGIDDLPPLFLLPFTPLVALPPILGVALQRALHARNGAAG